ncbi:MAG: stage III sporulation protein AF [Oscillospiraceae bacterium]
MELVRSWLIGVTAAALVVALADCLAPDGAVKKIGKLTGGLLLAVAILQPLVKLDFASLSGSLAEYRMEAEGYSTALETENERLVKSIIEEQTAAYIQDKAAALGVDCTVEVTCGADDDGSLYPATVTVYGDLTREQTDSLSRIIEGDLAIPTQNQQYERTKEQ